MSRHKIFALGLALLTIFTVTCWVTAYAQTYSAHAKRYAGGTYFQRHPYQKNGLIGAGTGAVAGGVLFGDKHRGRNIVRGAALGGVLGLGYEYLKKRGTIP